MMLRCDEKRMKVCELLLDFVVLKYYNLGW
jgi:hypothetical protein